ncbi:hypothetical protein PS858_04955 [Pseudomonas fluorescens]|jgi:uncharacterized protein YceK|uniref:YceK/YidQ family lipoprotein n=1 Tax=Pseudomonas fluorescens TaxID=294 RepID=A0A5E7EHN4_PSEFL|nr:hypothetical protein PS676_03106 [Pseudomonas fluorescens]VVO26304.1 hypothetical protein PS704_04635 [Pseudomonas fluorescens]VVP43466.1 hypothetical protein PS858_04955 [Pseudomonas fluorescens]
MNCGLTDRNASLPDVHGGQILTIKAAVLFGTLSLALSGCGTAVTVLQNDEDAARDLRKQKTYCQSIPRIYSGLAYDFCVLNAPPDPTGFLVPLVLLDLALSGALDTVALPYTIYRQGVDGNLRIYWRPGRG